MSLLRGSETVRASSVLNRKAEFAAKHVLDRSDDTCWNSDQGLPQSLAVKFGRTVTVSSVSLQFQGGFVGQDCDVYVSDDGKAWTKTGSFYPSDNTDVQTFPVPPSAGKRLKIEFTRSTDFYGRVTVYSLDLCGTEGDGGEAVTDSSTAGAGAGTGTGAGVDSTPSEADVKR